MRIALVGDHDPAVRAHAAIPVALDRAGERLGVEVAAEWRDTDGVPIPADGSLADVDGIWCVPASPYRSMEGALSAIRFARVAGRPFLGTCGGFQHALVEWARNSAGIADADHAETRPDAGAPVVSALACSLVGRRGAIHLAPRSRAARWYGGTSGTEEYVCSYGMNPAFRGLFDGPFRVTGWDGEGDPRVVELDGHPFFLGTLFQPELRSEGPGVHPLVEAFMRAASAAAGRRH